MPELPEVETIARVLKPQLAGRSIVGVRNTWRRHIDRPEYDEFAFRLQDQRIRTVARRGKFLLLPLEGGDTLLIHLRMSGHLFVSDATPPVDKHTHTIFELADGQELRFRDTRKFGRVYLVADPAEIVGKLGPEPLESEFTPAALEALLHGRSRTLKPFLLDQTMIAGIGNIYADESLFYAGLHPQRGTDTLNTADIRRLHAGIQRALQLGIEREGASISSYVKPDGEKGDMQNNVFVFRRTDQACFTCGEPIRRIVLGGRSTHFCANCQK
jgi:formamidopyrimidine-DNA glycosylase